MAPNQLDPWTALGDRTRRTIFERLAEHPAAVGELAQGLPVSRPAVSQHLKVLKDAGLVAQGRDAQWRPCRLEPTRLADVAMWVEQYRRLWEERFDRLDAYLRELQQQEEGGDA